MMQLDTNALLWSELEFERLSVAAKSALIQANTNEDEIAISAVTLYEIAWLARRGRIQLRVPATVFLHMLEENYRVIPVTSSIAFIAAQLPDPFPKDPMDRLIAATALSHDFTLITADRSILASNACKLLW